MERPPYSTITKYHSIYGKTYWGGHKGFAKQPIIHARNWFVLKYKIVSWKEHPVKVSYLRNKLHLDHTECYEDIHGRLIYLYSMYDKRNVPDFTPIYCMYNLDQRTAICIFETTKSKNKMMTKIASHLPFELNRIIITYLGHKDVWFKLFEKQTIYKNKLI